VTGSARGDRSTEVDVLIVGGGPAGTACALTLQRRPDLDVVIVERSAYDRPRAGEGLSPGTRPLLDYLGVWDRFSQSQSLRTHSTRAAWGSPTPSTLDYVFTVHGSGWSLDRMSFDAMLADEYEARGGVLHRMTTVVAMEHPGERWRVDARDSAGRSQSYNAKFVVVASGRAARLLSPEETSSIVHDHLVAVGGRVLQTGSPTRDEGAIEVEACPHGWWYSVPVPQGGMMVQLMTDADIARDLGATDPGAWQELLGQTTLTSRRVGASGPPPDLHARSCSSRQLRPGGGAGWLAVGDALASHDPLSSTGIAHAMGTGVHGAIAVIDALVGDGEMLAHHLDAVGRDYHEYLVTRRRYYAQERRFAQHRFWRRRQAAVALDAEAVVRRCERAGGPPPSVHLEPRMSAALLDSLSVATHAHAAVRAVLSAHPHVPDQRAILGLQELIDEGLVEVVAQ